jgi:hypothetical protein
MDGDEIPSSPVLPSANRGFLQPDSREAHILQAADNFPEFPNSRAELLDQNRSNPMSKPPPIPNVSRERPMLNMPELLAVPKLSTGDDVAAAQHLLRLYNESQIELRRAVALGLAAWEIKEMRLKHGEWGRWLGAHAPGLCWRDSVSGRPGAGSQLTSHMELTRYVLISVGFPTIDDYLREVLKFPASGICSEGKFLLLRESEVPADILPLRQKICALVNGSARRQLSHRRKPTEGSPNGGFQDTIQNLKKWRVRTTEQRDLLAGLAEEQRLLEFEYEIEFFSGWLSESMSVGNLGMMTSSTIGKLCEATERAASLGRRILETRKGGRP